MGFTSSRSTIRLLGCSSSRRCLPLQRFPLPDVRTIGMAVSFLLSAPRMHQLQGFVPSWSPFAVRPGGLTTFVPLLGFHPTQPHSGDHPLRRLPSRAHMPPKQRVRPLPLRSTVNRIASLHRFPAVAAPVGLCSKLQLPPGGFELVGSSVFVMPWQRPCCPVQALSPVRAFAPSCQGDQRCGPKTTSSGLTEPSANFTRNSRSLPFRAGGRATPLSYDLLGRPHFSGTTAWLPTRCWPREGSARSRPKPRACARSNQPPSSQKERGQRRTLAEKPSVAFPEAARVSPQLAPGQLSLLNLRRPLCRRRSLSRAAGPHGEWGSVLAASLTRLLAGNALWPWRGQVRDRAVRADPKIHRFGVAPVVPRRELSPRGVRRSLLSLEPSGGSLSVLRRSVARPPHLLRSPSR